MLIGDIIFFFATPVPAPSAEIGKGYLRITASLFIYKGFRLINQIDIKSATQAAIGSTQDHMNFFDFLPRHQQWAGLITGLFSQAAQHLRKLGRIRAKVLHIRLRTTQSRGGDHIHGLGNLLGFFNRSDFILDIF